MNEPHDPNETVTASSTPADSLDAGLAAGFGRRVEGPASVLSALGSTFGSVRPVLLKEAEGESALVVKPASDAMPSKAETGDRYQLSGEIARGGMGAVLRGRDVDLGRDLAVKVLLEKYANRPDVARRFIEEAQIGGQLQHPGVVPVYDIGRFGDRPFFTMKLVKGQTLSALLAERTELSADRPRLLLIALQVAQALAYAHAKGVIHRDLKPANIMVGAFGEVQVMDWGLAKVLAEGGIADEEKASRAHQVPEDVTMIRTARSTGSAGSFGTDTEAGSILGTPAYMPPEQASGDLANLDRRADVFGLGAILCEILTGKPPYLGRSGEEVRRKAANGDLADATARLDGCGADPELIALTKTCLVAEANDRPKDAQELADALAAYLNGVQERLQAAQRERAVAVAREAEQRKRRKVQSLRWPPRWWRCCWAAGRSPGGATSRPRPAVSATPATSRPGTRSRARPRKRSRPGTRPRRPSPSTRPRNAPLRAGPIKKRHGSGASSRTLPCCATWTPSTSFAGAVRRANSRTRRSLRRGPGTCWRGSGPTPSRCRRTRPRRGCPLRWYGRECDPEHGDRAAVAGPAMVLRSVSVILATWFRQIIQAGEQMMKRIKLATHGPEFSRIVYGTWRLLEMRPTSQEINRRLHACVELGITTIDTAEIYGLYEVEQQLGQALALSPGLRDQLELVTKAGIYVPCSRHPERRTAHYNATGPRLLKSLEKSLRLLGTDHVELFLVHRPDWLTRADDTAAGLNELLRRKDSCSGRIQLQCLAV